MYRRFVKAIAAAAIWLCIPGASALAQGEARAFNVFLDCSGFHCDEEFFRTEIVSVN